MNFNFNNRSLIFIIFLSWFPSKQLNKRNPNDFVRSTGQAAIAIILGFVKYIRKNKKKI